MKKRSLSLILITAITLSACGANKSQIGQQVGAIGGAAAGVEYGTGDHKGAIIALMAILGAVVGEQVGRYLDETDWNKAEDAAQESLETDADGESTTWSNPDTGNSGSVTPTRTWETRHGQECREFETTILTDDEEQTATGLACRDDDGVWTVVEDE